MGLTTGVALLAHAAVLAALRHGRVQDVPRNISPALVFFELVPNTFNSSDPASPRAPEPASGAARPPPSSASLRSFEPPAGHESKVRDEPSAEPSTDFTFTPTSPDGVARRETTPPIDLGIGPGAAVRWAIANPSALPPDEPPPAPPATSTTGGLQEALDAHDQELGIGPAGAVVSGAYEAMHSDVAPQLGVAVLTVTVLASGDVGVHVLRASGEFPDWSHVAEVLRARLKKQPPHLGGTHTGLTVSLRVVAEERWPDGAPVHREAPRLVSVPLTWRSTTDSVERSCKQNHVTHGAPVVPGHMMDSVTVQLDGPGVFVEHRGKLGDVQAGLGLNGNVTGPVVRGSLDVSNIGASPARRVEIKVLEQRAF